MKQLLLLFVIQVITDAAQECEAQYHAEQGLKIDSIAVFLDKFDHTIVNNSSIQDLTRNVTAFMETLK